MFHLTFREKFEQKSINSFLQHLIFPIGVPENRQNPFKKLLKDFSFFKFQIADLQLYYN